MEEQKPDEFEFYDEDDGNGQKIVRVERVEKGLTDEELGKKILDTILTIESEYKQLIVFWNEISNRWGCELRTEIIPLNQTWLAERRELLKPVSLERAGKHWIIKGNKEVTDKKIMAIMQEALEKKRKSEIWKK